MAKSPSHEFGQIIGNILEDTTESLLKDCAKKHNLFLDKKGIRGVKYRDVKLSCLMSIYPGEDVGVLIHDASPYKEFVDDPEFMGEMSATGEAEAGVALGRTSYLAGEIFALTRALMEKIPVLEYLEADLALQLKAPNGDSEDDNNGSGGGPSSSGGGVE